MTPILMTSSEIPCARTGGAASDIAHDRIARAATWTADSLICFFLPLARGSLSDPFVVAGDLLPRSADARSRERVSNSSVDKQHVAGNEARLVAGQEYRRIGHVARLAETADRHTRAAPLPGFLARSEEHTSELQSHVNLVCRLLLEKK